MQVLPFMPSLKILSAQFVANAFLAILIVLYPSPSVLLVLCLRSAGDQAPFKRLESCLF